MDHVSPSGDKACVEEQISSDNGIGSMENIHNKAHDTFPVPFSGARLIINKGLSSNFQVNHSISLGPQDQSGYKFGVTYVGNNKVSDTESYPIYMSELQPNGQMQAQIIHRFTPTVFGRYCAQLQSNSFIGQQGTLEFRAPRTQTSVTVINPSIDRNQIMGVFDYMRQVSKRLSLGSMFFYQYSQHIPSNQDGFWSVGGKYDADTWQTALTIRPWQSALHSTFQLRVNENLQLAAEFESSFQQQSNTTTLGYKYELSKGSLIFKSSLDSNWNVSSSLEKKLLPLPFSFTLCAIGNHVQSKYSFGIGLMVG